jgi:thymidylate kinase
MPSVALIGPDGAGKTTVTRMLEQSGLLPFKYLYMGVEVSASNFALPTSRLARRLRGRSRGVTGMAEGEVSRATSEPGPRGGRRGRLRSVARLANRLAEEWYRHLVSWHYQWRGFVVLYDRYFLFDFAPEILVAKTLSREQRLHLWCLTHLCPRPDLVIFLDAPGTVLFARKAESSVEELERRRQGFLQQAEKSADFVRVDATQPLAEVYDEVVFHVLRISGGRRLDAATAT